MDYSDGMSMECTEKSVRTALKISNTPLVLLKKQRSLPNISKRFLYKLSNRQLEQLQFTTFASHCIIRPFGYTQNILYTGTIFFLIFSIYCIHIVLFNRYYVVILLYTFTYHIIQDFKKMSSTICTTEDIFAWLSSQNPVVSFYVIDINIIHILFMIIIIFFYFEGDFEVV